MIPFGLRNAPLELHIVIVYIDDLLECSYDKEEHKKHLKEFFERVYRHNIALSNKKFDFVKTKIEFLDLIISRK